MFTGLVETVGVLRARSGSPVARACIEAPFGPLELGESISVNGVCLTVDRIRNDGFDADLSAETLRASTLGGLEIGSKVHLERALSLGERLGGHLVLGHVDGVGTLRVREEAGTGIKLRIEVPHELSRFLAEKGSIAVDGVSLTINRTGPSGTGWFEVMVVPHTLGRTLLGQLRQGGRINIEVDVMARYVARQVEFGALPLPGGRTPLEANEAPDEQPERDARILSRLREGGFL